MYDLIGAVCGKSQSLKNSGLFSISFGEDRAGTWGLSFWSGVERDDLADIGEAFDHSGDAQMEPCFLKLTAQQAQDHQSQDAIEGMNSELLVGPVVSGPEGEDKGVLHASEGCFDMGLSAFVIIRFQYIHKFYLKSSQVYLSILPQTLQVEDFCMLPSSKDV